MSGWEIAEFWAHVVALAAGVAALFWGIRRLSSIDTPAPTIREGRPVRLTFAEDFQRMRIEWQRDEQAQRRQLDQLRELTRQQEASLRLASWEEIDAADLPEAIVELKVAADRLEEDGFDEPAKLLRDQFRLYASRWLRHPARSLDGVQISVIRAGRSRDPDIVPPGYRPA